MNYDTANELANGLNRTVAPVSVGDIFYDSWGYNMTIVDFYQVVRVTPHGAEVRGLRQTETATGYLCGTTVPTQQQIQSHGVLRARQYGDGQISLRGTIRDLYQNSDSTRSVHLSRWDGRPMYFNHCD